MDTDVMTLQEAAKYLKMSKQTVARYAAKGVIPGNKAGELWRFRRDLLERWLSGGLESHAALRSQEKTQ